MVRFLLLLIPAIAVAEIPVDDSAGVEVQQEVSQLRGQVEELQYSVKLLTKKYLDLQEQVNSSEVRDVN